MNHDGGSFSAQSGVGHLTGQVAARRASDFRHRGRSEPGSAHGSGSKGIGNATDRADSSLGHVLAESGEPPQCPAHHLNNPAYEAESPQQPSQR
jgi:hypothetical protein